MFTRRQSTAFLMDIVNRGADFVKTLKIVYPKAGELNEKDFDWLFDCPELEHFLDWFCNTVGEENVLKPIEVEAYENLLISGKPMLEEETLEQVLKTCQQSSQLRDTTQENETLHSEILEKEMQMLKGQCACWIKQRNKLEMHIISMKQKSCYLEEKVKKARRELNNAYLQLEVDNFQSNDVFNQACKVAKDLVQWYGEPGNVHMKPLVAMMDLNHCLKLEEKFTEDLLGFLPKALKSITNGMEARNAEELGHMELSYLCSQRLLVMTSAEIEGMSSALQRARKALNAAKENKVKEEEEDELRFHIAACQDQRSILQNEVDQVMSQLLMPLLQGNAHLLRLPVIRGELDLEAIQLGHIESLQEEAVAQLMGQLSQLEVLKLLLLLEEKNLHQMNTEMLAIVNESEAKLQKLQSYLEASTFSVMQSPQKLVDPSDLTTLRVWKILDLHGQEKQLFCTYEMLAGLGSQLCQEIKMLQMQLVTPLSQLPKLESDQKILYSMMYGNSNLLMLRAQDLSESLEQISTLQTELYQMIADIQSDVKVKRQFSWSRVQPPETECNLYINFFNNPAEVKRLVEELEEKANSVCF